MVNLLPSPGSSAGVCHGAWQIFRELSKITVRVKHDFRCVVSHPQNLARAEIGMDPLPPLSPETLIAALRGQFEQLCLDVTAALNNAPTGHVLSHSEEPVRDLLADFRQAVYQTALQLRIDAAEAAFSPSGPPHRPPDAE